MATANSFNNTLTGTLTMANGLGLITPQAVGNWAITAYDTTNSTNRTFMIVGSGTAPSLAFSKPTNSTLTWDGGVIGGTTPAAGTFTTVIGNTDIYTTASTTWTPTIALDSNLTGTPSVTENTYKKIGKTVFCRCKISGLSVTSSNASTGFSITLPENQDTNTSIPYAWGCMLYVQSGTVLVPGSIVDWGSGEANKVGVYFYPPTSGATNYAYVSLIYQSA